MPHKITLLPSGHRFEVGDDDVILEAALAHGIRMPHGCRAGSCKSCRAKVVSGTVDVGRLFPAPRFVLRQRQFDGYTLMCRACATSDLVIEVDEQPPMPPPRRVDATVEGVDRLSRDVALLRLRVPAPDAVSFVAGQYTDLLLPGGARRSYSMANPPAAAGDEVLHFHVRHLPGGLFTDPLFAGRMHPGMALTIESPLGSFYLRESPAPAVLLASGTGYAPIRAMLLDHLPREQARPIVLYWGGRTLADLYALDEITALQARHPHLRFVPVLSEAGDDWPGRRGLVHRAVMADLPDLSACHVYACGTPPMVEAARRDFSAECALPPEHFFCDSFTTAAEAAREGLAIGEST